MWFIWCSRKTFESINAWINDARTLGSTDIVIVLVGNKADLDAERQVSYMEASKLANDNSITFYILMLITIDIVYLETSALTGTGIEDTFLKVTRTILTKIETGAIDPESMGAGIQYGNANITRFEEIPPPDKSKCC